MSPIDLSFPGATDVVAAIHAELRRTYRAVPPRLNVGDEPAGDFGIAHFYGLDRLTARDDDFRLTFDAGRIPSRYVVCHELGHALSLNVTLKRGGDPFTNGLFDEFWEARGFTRAIDAPRTPMEGQELAMRLDRESLNGGYRFWPEEHFADAFGAINSYGQGTLITATYGAGLEEARLRDFFRSLGGLYMATLDQEDLRNIANYLLPEIIGAIKAGFNETLPAVADRVVAGDKKTATPEID